jgi:hypothetical protein
MPRTVTIRRKCGQVSRYLNGGTNALMRETQPEDRQVGEWPRERLLKMDAKFCAAMERAFKRGRELRSSASGQQRPGAGDRDRLSMAS